jgi:hypothetical protein
MGGSYTKLEPPPELVPLLDCLKRIPAVKDHGLMAGFCPDGRWWAIFWIDIDHPLSWWVVRRLAVVLNDVSGEEESRTALIPIAMKPTWTVGIKPLSWIVESRRPGVEPAAVVHQLKAQLPDPLEDESLWPVKT